MENGEATEETGDSFQRSRKILMSRRSRAARRRSPTVRPWGENLEDRRLLTAGGTWPTYISPAELRSLLREPLGYPVVRPNTPVLPFGAKSAAATFIDPSVHVANPYAVIVSPGSFVGPFAKLDATSGVVKIGGTSAILDNVSITANPSRARTRGDVPEIRIGSQVVIDYGATINGPAVIGGFDAAGAPTFVGPGAVIDGGDVQAGAFVSALARVGPGVTVPSGMKVLPGANVTSQAEASDPALGKVTPVTVADLAGHWKSLTTNLSLRVGYATLYQGQSATGVNPGIAAGTTGIFNGNLAAVTGANNEPGSPTATTPYLPPGALPKFPTPHRGLIGARLPSFKARVTGNAPITQRARFMQSNMGLQNSIRADQGQPIGIGSIAATAAGVTINSPDGGALTIGQGFTAGARAVILGGAAGTKTVIGDDVTIGPGAVVQGTSLGAGSTVGPLAYLLNSSFPAGTNIPAGAIYVNDALVGYVSR